MNTLIIPMIIDRNRIRGNKTGAIFVYDDDLYKVRQLIKKIFPNWDKENITKNISWILNYYHEQQLAWINDKNECVGQVTELTINAPDPENTFKLIMGEERILRQYPNTINANIGRD